MVILRIQISQSKLNAIIYIYSDMRVIYEVEIFIMDTYVVSLEICQ